MTVAKIAGNRIRFQEAAELANRPHTSLFKEEGYLDVRVPVARLNAIDSAIKQSIWELINRYCDSLNGVLIAFSHLRLLSSDIELSDFLDTFQDLRVFGTFIVFRPQAGNYLDGIITKVSTRHLGSLVHRNFTSSIEFGGGLKFDKFKVDERITFQVEKVENRNGICHIRGLLTKDMLNNPLTEDIIEVKNPCQPVEFSGPSSFSGANRACTLQALGNSDSGVSTDLSTAAAVEESFSDATVSIVSTPTKKRKVKTTQRIMCDGAALETATGKTVGFEEETQSEPNAETSANSKKKKKRAEKEAELLKVESGSGWPQSCVNEFETTQFMADKEQPHATKKRKKSKRQDETMEVEPETYDYNETSDNLIGASDVTADADVLRKKKKRKKSSVADMEA